MEMMETTAAAAAAVEGGVVVIREYEAERDRMGVEAVERRCEVGPSGGGMSLFTDLLGDPLCRVRHSPPFLMLVRTPLFIFFVFFSNLIIRLSFFFLELFFFFSPAKLLPPPPQLIDPPLVSFPTPCE